MPIDKILSRAYSRRMATATNPKPPLLLARRLGPLAERQVPIAVPPPDPAVIERRAATYEEKRESLQDRFLLHRRNHVKRLDGRGTIQPAVPEFLKHRGVRRVR